MTTKSVCTYHSLSYLSLHIAAECWFSVTIVTGTPLRGPLFLPISWQLQHHACLCCITYVSNSSPNTVRSVCIYWLGGYSNFIVRMLFKNVYLKMSTGILLNSLHVNSTMCGVRPMSHFNFWLLTSAIRWAKP